MTNCSVCFDSLNDKKIQCYDVKCGTSICYECMNQYIFSLNTLPKCVNPKCNIPYILSQIKNISEKAIYEYKSLCFNYFLNTKEDEIKNNIAKDEIINKIRNDRIITVKTFPKSISKVIDMCMGDRLKKINKTNTEIIDNIINTSGRFCMLSYCNGKLDNDFKCLKCEIEFCKKCEKIKKEETHICKESDVDSVEYIKNIGKCPNCNISIEKSMGCRSMKCANCHTMFDYYTGEFADHGGHNTDIQVKDELKLSTLYADFYDEKIILNLREFEMKKPSNDIETKYNKIIKYVTEYVSNGKNLTDLYTEKISKIFDNYIKMKYDYILYMKKISEIQDLHENGKLNEDRLLLITYL